MQLVTHGIISDGWNVVRVIWFWSFDLCTWLCQQTWAPENTSYKVQGAWHEVTSMSYNAILHLNRFLYHSWILKWTKRRICLLICMFMLTERNWIFVLLNLAHHRTIWNKKKRVTSDLIYIYLIHSFKLTKHLDITKATHHALPYDTCHPSVKKQCA